MVAPEDRDIAAITERLGKTYVLEGTLRIKRFPACNPGHPLIDASVKFTDGRAGKAQLGDGDLSLKIDGKVMTWRGTVGTHSRLPRGTFRQARNPGGTRRSGHQAEDRRQGGLIAAWINKVPIRPRAAGSFRRRSMPCR